ncbi:MAG: hypothetical protein Fur0026_02670 [Sideroxydans sp.]
MDEARIISIEEKITFQEDMIEELNKAIHLQQQQIERLEGFCAALARELRALAAAGSDHKAAANEKPPHY